MGNVWDELTNDGPEFLTAFGRQVTFRQQSIAVLISRAPIEQMLNDGGFAYSATYVLRIYAPIGSAMALSPPTFGEKFIVFGKESTILTVTNRPPSPWIDVMVGPTATV